MAKTAASTEDFGPQVKEHAKGIGLITVIILGHLLLAAAVVFVVWVFEHVFHLFWVENKEPHLFGVIPLRYAFDTADGFVILGVSIRGFMELIGIKGFMELIR